MSTLNSDPVVVTYQFGHQPPKLTSSNKMTVKRRNHGRNRPAGSRGHVRSVRCDSTSKMITKDKAVKRFLVKNIVDASSMRDIMDACVYENYQVPKLYIKMYYCIEAAIHQRIVRGRSAENRKIRAPPQRFRRKPEKKKESA